MDTADTIEWLPRAAVAGISSDRRQGRRDRSYPEGGFFGMAIDTETRASRRNILAAALGGLGGLLAGRLGSPNAAAAAQDDPVTVGGTFQGTAVTSIENTDATGTSLKGYHATAGKGVEAAVGGTGYGLYATATASGGRAVYASALDETGVWATSTDTAVSDFLTPSNRSGVIGTVGDVTDIATNTDETAIYGFSDVSFNSAGVWGDTIQGVGVIGTGDWGVLGAGNVGVRALGTIGVLATGTTALQTSGKLVISGRSGHAYYVHAGHYYVDVPVSGMSAGADVIATLRTRKAGYYIAAVVSYSGKFRLYLNKTTSTGIRFNYLVLNG